MKFWVVLLLVSCALLNVSHADEYDLDQDILTAVDLEAEERAQVDAELNGAAPSDDDENEEDSPLSAVSISSKVESDPHAAPSTATTTTTAAAAAPAKVEEHPKKEEHKEEHKENVAQKPKIAESGSTVDAGKLGDHGKITGPQEGSDGAVRHVSEEPFKSNSNKALPPVSIPGVANVVAPVPSGCFTFDAFGNCVLPDANSGKDPRQPAGDIKCDGSPLCCAACKTSVFSIFDASAAVKENRIDKLCTLVSAEQRDMCKEFMNKKRTDLPGCSSNGECLIQLMNKRAPPQKTCVEAGVCIANAENAPTADLLISEDDQSAPIYSLEDDDGNNFEGLPQDAEIDDPDVLYQGEPKTDYDISMAQVVENHRAPLKDEIYDDIPDNSDLLPDSALLASAASHIKEDL